MTQDVADDLGAVTAVVLTLGEPTTARALDSIRRQTVPVAEVVTIEGIAPFHRAINEAASRVRTPFFVQVDADMVLDDDCVEQLRAAAGARIGIVIGHLRDPLYGPIEGVKLFRTGCFAWGGMPDTVSPDTDFLAGLQPLGWAGAFARRQASQANQVETFGEHLPDYDNQLYTYSKFSIEGRRWYYRRNAAALRHRLSLLGRSHHPSALLAEISLGYGVLLEGQRDLLEPYTRNDGFERMTTLLGTPANVQRPRDTAIGIRTWLSPETAFRRGYELGQSMRAGHGREAIQAVLRQLHEAPHVFDWLLQVGFCRGLLGNPGEAAACERDWRLLAVFSSYYRPGGLLRRAVLRAQDEVRRRLAGRAGITFLAVP